MNRRKIFCCLLAASAAAAPLAARAEISKEVEAKVALETSIESRLQTVLRSMLGSNDVVVIVNVSLSKEEEGSEVLPGVPIPQNPAVPGALGINLPNVRGLSVTILLDQSAGEEDVQTVREISSKLLGLDPRHSSALTIQKIKFQRSPAAASPVVQAATPGVPGPPETRGSLASATPAVSAKEVAHPSFLVSVLWLLLAAAGMVLAYRRFLSPLLSLLRDMINLRQQTPAPRAPAEEAESEAAAAPVPASSLPGVAAALPRETGRGETEPPFSFITERDVPHLVFVLRRATPREAAVVLHYIPAALASQALAALPSEAQRKVVSILARVRQFDEADVRPIEGALRRRIEYLIGGEEKIADLLDQLPPGMQSQLLETISEKDRGMTERLSKRLVMLQDLGTLEAADLKALSRRVPVQTLAAVLRKSEELKANILPKLSEGLRDWLTQEIELSVDPSPEVLEADRRRVLNALSQLVREGRVTLKKAAAPSSEPGAAPSTDDDAEAPGEETGDSWLLKAWKPERAEPPAPAQVPVMMPFPWPAYPSAPPLAATAPAPGMAAAGQPPAPAPAAQPAVVPAEPLPAPTQAASAQPAVAAPQHVAATPDPSASTAEQPPAAAAQPTPVPSGPTSAPDRAIAPPAQPPVVAAAPAAVATEPRLEAPSAGTVAPAPAAEASASAPAPPPVAPAPAAHATEARAQPLAEPAPPTAPAPPAAAAVPDGGGGAPAASAAPETPAPPRTPAAAEEAVVPAEARHNGHSPEEDDTGEDVMALIRRLRQAAADEAGEAGASASLPSGGARPADDPALPPQPPRFPDIGGWPSEPDDTLH